MHPIELRGARTHHLRGVDVVLRPGELVVVTGVSGAGKSSLAFDTLYAEAQRRFVESFSPYARQFLERLERPPMDALEPVAAGVAVDRRSPAKSSRSTLATAADLEAYLSVLFAREARPLCPDCGKLAEQATPATTAAAICRDEPGIGAALCYPLEVADVEAYLDVREVLLGDGYHRLLVAGRLRDLDELPPAEALASPPLEVLVDRLKLGRRTRGRLAGALEQAWQRGEGSATLWLFDGDGGGAPRRQPLTRGLSCPGCGRAFAPARAALFSYQSPLGACPTCRGFGRVLGIDWRKVVPDDRLSLAERAIKPWRGRKATWERRMLRRYCEAHTIDMQRPWADLDETARRQVIEGEGIFRRRQYPGVRAWFRWLETKSYKMHVRVLLSRYRSYDPCPDCGGKRLGPAALGYRVDGLDLGDWHRLELGAMRARLAALSPGSAHGLLARDELGTRLGYLERVGLGYLSLDRQTRTLSGGEAQRVALTAALGSSLTGALFVLDEPTVGLHPTDVTPLVEAMTELSRRGNAVVVVEHDPTVLAAADRVLEIGPGAGPAGGSLVFDGTPAQARSRPELAAARAMAAPTIATRTPSASHGELLVQGAAAHNLTALTVAFPLRALVVVCGPSGSGKSSLVDEVLYRALAQELRIAAPAPGPHAGLQGAEAVRAVRLVDQSPLGRTSRGNAATYLGAWTRVRALFAARPEAQLRRLGPGHFSFNVAGGRCEACAGEGAETVEMQFLADVRLTCPVCHGRRFNDEVLGIELGGRSVDEVLAMSIDEVLDAFDLDATITRALRPAAQLGLGYLGMGQPLSTLSGGEAQRLKLARALREVRDGTVLVVDEPSAGLHADEVGLLCKALHALVAAGATVVVVDHDLGVVGAADWVVELGPGAGADGGRLVAACGPAELVRRDTRTGRALRGMVEGPVPGASRSRRQLAALRSKSARGGPSPRAAAAGASGRRVPPHAITVEGAREHNLAAIDVAIEHGKLVVVTGPSGSGKSSLAFDVVFAEGQRRFVETLTPYARQFLPTLPRPDVDRVSGVPPSVALEQRTARAAVSSTVATVTEIAHYLRLLYAKLGVPHCPDCQQPVTSVGVDELYARLRGRRGKQVLLAPVVRGRKGAHLEVFAAADRVGIEWALADGQLVSTDTPPRLRKSREHTIMLLMHEGAVRRLDRGAFVRALAAGKGQLVLAPYGAAEDEARHELLSSTRSCVGCGRALPELDPRWFSFNTAQGRCPTCEGSGCAGGLDALRAGGEIDEVAEPCPDCQGARLAAVPRAVRLGGERYHEACARSVRRAAAHFAKLRFEGSAARVAEAPLRELRRRLDFVEQVGLGYLGLGRRARTLSGGEMQRLRLAAQLGSGLTGALYVLDEPTVGLHPRDTARLIANLRALVATGSTVLVVEHDADTIRAADQLIDLGPAGGRGGGRVMACGPAAEVLADQAHSPTARALADEQALYAVRERLGVGEQMLVVRGASTHNLRIGELRIPSGRMVVVAGVSGSGKSTLVNQVIFPAVRRLLGRKIRGRKTNSRVELPGNIERALVVDQAPIGRTSRSVPATFVGLFDHLRRLFAAVPEARARGYGPARFSFNSARGGGRCEGCGGLGVVAHEMAFLPDVKTRCELCAGRRFEPATLEVRYRGLDIGAVLALTVQEALERFSAHRKIAAPLRTLCDLGMGYVQLGQGSPSLSGGEAQRLKLAKELTAGRLHKPTLYLLDEPTTGLHHLDVGLLIGVLDRLVARGDSLLIIEHHPAVVAAADQVIELGPGGGEDGGCVIAQGAPAEVAALDTPTGAVLRRLFEASHPRTGEGWSADSGARPTTTAAGRNSCSPRR